VGYFCLLCNNDIGTFTLKLGEMVMKTLLSSASNLANIEFWNKNQKQRFGELISDDWMTHHFPPDLFYFRSLTPAERVSSKYDGDLQDVWYGVFEPISGKVVVVSDDPRVLFREAKKNMVIIVYCH